MANFNFLSGEVDDITVNFSARLIGETISATKWNFYFPVGVTGFQSATAGGGTNTAMTCRFSATAAPGTIVTCSAAIITTGSARKLVEWFTISIG